MSAVERTPVGHVIVCGLVELGLSIVEQLAYSGVEAVVVDELPDPRLRQALETAGVPLVHGSPRAAAVLERAGLARAQAVVCVEDNDLDSLEVALLARSIRPEVRVVVQMANAAVGRALREVTGQDSALDVADLAAPSIVQACLGLSEHELVLANEHFVTREVHVRAAGTLRSHYGELVPVAVIAPDGAVDVCPARDRPLEPGDRVMLLGPPAAVAAFATESVNRVAPPVIRRLAAVPAGLSRALLGRNGRGLRYAVSALIGLVVVATLVVHFFYRTPAGGHLSFLTSTYFTVETVATVGFGDFSFATQSAWMRVFGIALIILGASAVTTMFALLTNFLVSRTLTQALGSTRGQRLRNHVVVVGLGTIGLRVTERLLELGRPVVVIERDEENRHIGQARELRVPIVLGDATLSATLDLANARHAAAVAVLTSSDLTNLETAISLGEYLAANEVDPPVIVRVFDRSLARTIEQGFGLHYVRSTTDIAAPYFVGAALGLDIILTFSVERERLMVARLTVAEAGGLAGIEMQELSARIRVIAILRAGATHLEHPPRRWTRFAPGDRAYLVGPYEDLLAVLRRDAAQVGD